MQVWIYANAAGGEEVPVLENQAGEYNEAALALTISGVEPAAPGIESGGYYTFRAQADPRSYGVPAQCSQAEPGFYAFGLAGPMVLPGSVDSKGPATPGEVKITTYDQDDPTKKRVEAEIAEEEARRTAEAEREREREEAERILQQQAEAQQRELEAQQREADLRAAQEQEEREREREAEELQRAMEEEEEARRRADEDELDRRETPEEVRAEGTIRDNPRHDLVDKKMEPTYEPDGDYGEVEEK